MNTAFASSKFDPAVHLQILPRVPAAPPALDDFIEVRNFSFFFRKLQALDSISLKIPNHRVTALIGPSGCGKSTLLRSLNRMNELVPGARHTGDILAGGESIFDPRLRLMNLRRTVGLVFQKSNPLPLSIYENIACAVRLSGVNSKDSIEAAVESSLRRAALWDEVKDRLRQDAFILSGGQAQRLCIARALACNPQILLLDEPCSSLDPVATGRIEELMTELSRAFTLVLVTHNISQAVRCADFAAFLYQGKLIESGSNQEVFFSPAKQTTIDYLEGAIW